MRACDRPTRQEVAIPGEREVRHLSWGEYLTRVVVEVYRCGVPSESIERVAQLPSKAQQLSKRFEDAVGMAFADKFSPAGVGSAREADYSASH
jgi:hypothetical protein